VPLTPAESEARYIESRLRQIDALRATRTHDKLKIERLTKANEAMRACLEQIANAGDLYSLNCPCASCDARRTLKGLEEDSL